MKKLYISLLLSYVVTLMYSQFLSAQDGQLDWSFGEGGIVTTAINVIGNSTLHATAVQSDGKVVAAGVYYNPDNYDFSITRFNADGNPDISFGVNGIVRTDIHGAMDEAFSVAIQHDGKIIAAGYTQYDPNNSFTSFSLVRYKTNGAIDSTFGTDGIALTHFGIFKSEAHSIVLQNDGKIIAAGYSENIGQNEFYLARFNSNGSLDTSFGDNGHLITPIGTSNEMINTVEIQNNGKIIAAGYYAMARYNEDGSIDNSFGTNGIAAYPGLFGKSMAIATNGKIITGGYYDSHFALVCFKQNGIPDSTFGVDGIKKTPIGLASEINSVRIQNDEKIIASGNAYFEAPTYYLALACYDMNGDPDPDFGINGIVTRQIGTWSNDISSSQIQADGKIIAAGSSNNGDSQKFTLICFNSNGALDNTFGVRGITDCVIGQSYSGINSIAVQPDGKIVATGYISDVNGTSYDIVVARYNTNGHLDYDFGLNGIVSTSVNTESTESASSIAIQGDGKIVVAGHTRNGIVYANVLVRYASSGLPDNTFGSNGIVTTPIGPVFISNASSVVIQDDGKIVTAGYSRDSQDIDYISLVRYNTNGSLDNSFGTNGISTTSFTDTSASYASSCALLSDNRIVVAGHTNHNFALACYNSDGKMDTTFGNQGKIITPVGTSSYANDVAVQRDEKIVAAGNSDVGIGLARYNADGTPDTSFGTNGLVIAPISGYPEVSSLALQNDGKIVIAGSVSNQTDFLIARFNEDGMPDNTFGTNGVVITPQVGLSTYEYANSILVQSDGNIVAGGISGNGFDNNYFKLVRYLGGLSTGIRDENKGVEQNSPVLEQNYPNPFNLSTKIKYQLPISGFVTLKIYNLMGQEIKTMVNQNQNMGEYEVEFSSDELHSGVYFYRLTIGNQSATKIMILSR